MILSETKDGMINVQLVGSSHELLLEASTAMSRLVSVIAPHMATERSCTVREAELELLEDLHGMTLERMHIRREAEGEISSKSEEPAEPPKRRRRIGGSCPVS